MTEERKAIFTSALCQSQRSFPDMSITAPKSTQFILNVLFLQTTHFSFFPFLKCDCSYLVWGYVPLPFQRIFCAISDAFYENIYWLPIKISFLAGRLCMIGCTVALSQSLRCAFDSSLASKVLSKSRGEALRKIPWWRRRNRKQLSWNLYTVSGEEMGNAK